MRSSTVRLNIEGENYADIIDAAEARLVEFLGVSFEDLPKHVSYEITITESKDVSNSQEYSAELIARVKDVRG